MTTTSISLNEINHQAIKILCREMGVVNTIRFIRQYSNGAGDYTKERKEIFRDKSLNNIFSEIEEAKKKG